MAKSSIAVPKNKFDPETIIAGLCAKASTLNCNEGRDVLRRYNHCNTYNQNKAAMSNNFNKAPLLETAKFLNIESCDTMRKDDLIHEIICQIQNLLPDTCQICNQLYKSCIGEAAYLACDICGQEVHKLCFMKQLGIDEGTMPNINPSNLPGIHYFCKACEDDVSRKLGIKFSDKRRQKKEAASEGGEHSTRDDTSCSQAVAGSAILKSDQSQDLQLIEVIHCSQVASGSAEVTPPSPAVEPNHNSDSSATQDDFPLPPPSPPRLAVIKADDSQSKSRKNNTAETDINLACVEPKLNQQKNKLCHYYASNSCKFGIKGTKCPFKHPERCSKLMKHGSKQPDGCNKGKSCTDFHPKMCPMSMTKHQCFDISCQLVHVRGTIRRRPANDKEVATGARSKTPAPNAPLKPPSAQEEPPPAPKSPPLDGQPSSFLELARLIKEELMEAMDTKIALAISQIPQQMPSAFPPPMPQYLHHLPYQPTPPMNYLPYQQWQQQAFKATVQPQTQAPPPISLQTQRV